MSSEESVTYANAKDPTLPSTEKYRASEETDYGRDSIDILSEDHGVPYLYQRRSVRQLLASLVLSILPWLLTTVFAFLSLALYINSFSCSVGPLGSYETGFSTDLALNMPIPIEKVKFSGTTHFYDNATGWLHPPDETRLWPANKRYVGTPNAEIEENWAILTEKRYFSLSEEEATRAWGDSRHEYIDERLGGYTAGFSMFHALHCINGMRKTLYPEYYPKTQKQARVHMEHCIDILRQSIQCLGSTTLVPTRFLYPLKHNYVNSDQEHTCRSFTFLRDYTTSRAKGGEGYIPRDQSFINKERHKLTLEFHELLPEDYVNAAT